MTTSLMVAPLSGCGAPISGQHCLECGRPTLLDAFSCAGVGAVGYDRAGFCVTGVDKDPQPRYPFTHYVGDAVVFLAEHGHLFAARHTSPPCQSFTAYRRKGHGVGDGYLNLIPDTRAALAGIEGPSVIENVESAREHLEQPLRLCGSSFGLDVRRHRLFEVVRFDLLVPPCDHSWQTPRFPPATNRTNLRSTVEVGVYRIPLPTQLAAMGVDRKVTLHELSEGLPPAYTEHLGRAMLAALTGARTLESAA